MTDDNDPVLYCHYRLKLRPDAGVSTCRVVGLIHAAAGDLAGDAVVVCDEAGDIHRLSFGEFRALRTFGEAEDKAAYSFHMRL